MLVAVGNLRGGEFDVNEVAPQRAGERLFEQPQIHLLLLLAGHAERDLRLGDDLTAAVDKAAVHMRDAAPLRPEPAAELVEFLLIHMYLLQN